MGLFGGRERKLEKWAAAQGLRADFASDRPRSSLLAPRPPPPSDVLDQDRLFEQNLPSIRDVLGEADSKTLGISHPPRVEDVIAGPWRGRPSAAFHLAWMSEGGALAEPEAKTRTYGLTEVPATLPALLLIKESRLQRTFEKLGGLQDVEIGNPEFDEKWRPYTEDPEFARELLDPRMIEFLLNKRSKNWIFEVAGPMVMARLRMPMLLQDPRSVEEVLDKVADFVDHIPQAVLEKRAIS